jgi:hypothetical protein
MAASAFAFFRGGARIMTHYLASMPVSGLTTQLCVEGQQLMQTVSDIFLGWTESDISGHDYYVRQLKDWKGSMDVDSAELDELSSAAELRSRTLAGDHARAGDPSAISGYLGSSETFDDAIAAFAERYADQNELDHAAFRAEIDEGRLESAELTS